MGRRSSSGASSGGSGLRRSGTTTMARRRRRIEQRDDGAPAEIKKIAKCWDNRGRGRRRVIRQGFCPGWSHDSGQKGLLSRVVAPPGIKGVFGRAGKIPSPRPTFSPGWIYHPGQKGPVFPRSRQILCLLLFLFTSILKLAFIC